MSHFTEIKAEHLRSDIQGASSERKESSNYADSELDLRQVLGIMLRQYKLIVYTTIIFLAGAFLFSFAVSARYTATALVIVDTSKKNLLDTASQFNNAAADNARIESEVEILKSDNILMKVIEDKRLITDPEFGVSLSTRDKLLGYFGAGEGILPTGREALTSVLNALRKATTVRRKGLTYLISVQVVSRSPEKAADIANAIANVYIELQVQSKIDAAKSGSSKIVEQSEAARKSLINAESNLNQYLTNNVERLAEATGRADLVQIRDAITTLTNNQKSTSAKLTTLRSSLEAGNWGSLSSVLEDEAALELQRQREKLLNTITTAGSDGASIIDLKSELSKVENQLAKAAETKAGELSDALQGTEKALAQTRQQITDVVAKADLPAEILTEINGLMRTSQNAKSTYELLLSRAQDLDTQAAIQIADSRLISPALEPDVPSFPNKRLILALALFAALAIGTALAFLYELFIGGFTSAEQLRSVTGASVAAVIPLTSPGVGSHSVADTIIDRPLSTFSEEIRKLRANVDRFLRTSRQLETRTSGSVIMVTSALPNEGKSTVALTLARAYAVHGYKTLLIDCDLRRPSIHRQLGIEPKTGLVELLRPSKPPVSVAQAITKDLKSPLTVIIGSRPADIATDHLLTDNAFSAIIQSSRKNFDYIIIDTPPIDAVVDGLYVAEHADAVVFAVHWAKTSQRFVTKSIDLLRRYMRDSSEIFMVLNQDGHHKQFAYQYGGYYTE